MGIQSGVFGLKKVFESFGANWRLQKHKFVSKLEQWEITKIKIKIKKFNYRGSKN